MLWIWVSIQIEYRLVEIKYLNLSAALCVKRQQEELSMPKAQLLIYMNTDLNLKHPSMDEMAEGFFLTKASMEFFRDLPTKRLTIIKIESGLVSPLFADNLSCHPPAVVVTAGFDPLRDEGDLYAQALRQANVEIYHRTHDSYIHGFVNMMLVDGVDYALKRICDDFKRFLPGKVFLPLKKIKTDKKSSPKFLLRFNLEIQKFRLPSVTSSRD